MLFTNNQRIATHHSMFPSVLFGYCLVIMSTAFAGALQAEWNERKPSHRITPKRSGHVAFPSPDSSHVYIFGGYAEESPSNRYVTNDLWRWNSEQQDWESVGTNGESPRARLVAAAAVLAGKSDRSQHFRAYVFGGWDPGTKQDGGDILETIHRLDFGRDQDSGTTNPTWAHLDVVTPGGPTSRHVAVAIPERNQIVLHNHRCHDMVWIFDADRESFVQQTTSGPCPSARGLHSATLSSKHEIVFFGGASQDQTMSNEVFVLDTKSWTWRKLMDNEKKAPSPRASPCLCRWSDDIVLVYGGAESSSLGLTPRSDVWALDLRKETWNCLLPDDQPASTFCPPARNAATLVEMSSSENGKEYLLTGGWAPFRETWDDNFVLRVHEDN
jgi:hypothetical protein